jgi:DME family drug/metabolite transporter
MSAQRGDSTSDVAEDAPPPSQHPHASAIPVRGVVFAFLATLCWSSSALLIDKLSTGYHLSALEISNWRILLVLPLLALYIVLHRPGAFRVDRRDLLWYGLAGIGITLSNLTWAVSVQLNQPAAAAALAFSAPAFIALGERVLFKTSTRRFQVGAIAVNLVGCGLASGLHSPAQLLHTPTGLVVGLANGLAFTLYTLLNRGIGTGRRRDPLTTLLAIFVVSEIGMLLWGLPVEGAHLFRLHLDATGWVLLMAVAVGPTLAAYAFFNSSLRVLPATVASLFTTLEPPTVALFAFLLLGRSVNALQLLGIGCIVSAVLAMQLSVIGWRGRKSDGSRHQGGVAGAQLD